MGKVAHLHARPLDDAAVAVDQRIDLIGQRHDFARQLALQPFGLSGADFFQRAASMVERPQTEDDADTVHDETAQAEDGERDVDPAGKGSDVLFDHRQVACHPKPRRLAGGIQHDLGFRHAHQIAARIAQG